MVTVSDIFEYLNSVAPVSTKMDFDNVGFLVGRGSREVTKILMALDITSNVVQEAISIGAELVVSHHPLFFSLKKVSDDDVTGRKILSLAENNISAICMHTNLDVARYGVNTHLAKTVGITSPKLLIDEGTNELGERYGLGCFGELEESVRFENYLQFVKAAINANGLRYQKSLPYVKKVAVLGGSGGNELDAAIKAGCDTYITADVKYDVFLSAAEQGINLIDGGHFCTENVVIKPLAEMLSQKFDGVSVTVSSSHIQVESFF